MKKISIICVVAIVSATALISCGGNETKDQPGTEQPTSMVEEPVGPIVTTDSTVPVHIEGDDQMKYNVNEISKIFDLLEEKDIPRVCFYHLVYAGRGSDLVEQDLSHPETRAAVDLIIDRTKALHDKGLIKEVLTVDNHADGP